MYAKGSAHKAAGKTEAAERSWLIKPKDRMDIYAARHVGAAEAAHFSRFGLSAQPPRAFPSDFGTIVFCSFSFAGFPRATEPKRVEQRAVDSLAWTLTGNQKRCFFFLSYPTTSS